MSIPDRSLRRFMVQPSEDERAKFPQVVDGVRVEWISYFPAATHFDTSSMHQQRCQGIDSAGRTSCGNAVIAPFGRALCPLHDNQRLDRNDRPAWLFATRAEIEMIDCMRVNGWTAEYFFSIASRARWTRTTSASGGSSQVDDLSQQLFQSTVNNSNSTSSAEGSDVMSSSSDVDDVIFMGVSSPPTSAGQHANTPAEAPAAPVTSASATPFHVEGELVFNMGAPPPQRAHRTYRRLYRSELHQTAARRQANTAFSFTPVPQPRASERQAPPPPPSPRPTTQRFVFGSNPPPSPTPPAPVSGADSLNCPD